MKALDDFLRDGFNAVPASHLNHLSADTKDTCYLTGDVRFCIVSECLDIIASCWGDDGAVRESVVADLQHFVVKELGPAMADEDPEASRSLLLGARSSLLTLLGSAGDLVYG